MLLPCCNAAGALLLPCCICCNGAALLRHCCCCCIAAAAALACYLFIPSATQVLHDRRCNVITLAPSCACLLPCFGCHARAWRVGLLAIVRVQIKLLRLHTMYALKYDGRSMHSLPSPITAIQVLHFFLFKVFSCLSIPFARLASNTCPASAGVFSVYFSFGVLFAGFR